MARFRLKAGSLKMGEGEDSKTFKAKTENDIIETDDEKLIKQMSKNTMRYERLDVEEDDSEIPRRGKAAEKAEKPKTPPQRLTPHQPQQRTPQQPPQRPAQNTPENKQD